MWIYVKTEPRLWTVGFYDPTGKWHPENNHSTPEEAAARVHWLNGGSQQGSLATGDEIRDIMRQEIRGLEAWTKCLADELAGTSALHAPTPAATPRPAPQTATSEKQAHNNKGVIQEKHAPELYAALENAMRLLREVWRDNPYHPIWRTGPAALAKATGASSAPDPGAEAGTGSKGEGL